MIRLKMLLTASMILLCPVGCSLSLVRDSTSESLFILGSSISLPSPILQQENTSIHRLLVDEVDSTSSLAGKRILFKRGTSEAGYYRFSRWVDPLPERFTILLINHIDSSGYFTSVGKNSGLIRGELLLKTEILDFVYNAERRPGQVSVKIRAELVKIEDRSLVDSKVFEEVAHSTSLDAAGAVGAFDRATQAVLDDMISWLHERVSLEKNG